MKPKAVFFDMDGVLYDSMPHHASTWTKALAEVGIAYNEADTYQNEGRTSTGTIQLAYRRELNRDATPDEVEAIYKRKTQLVTDLPMANIMPGVTAFIEQLRHQGIAIAVVTGSKQPSLLQRLQRDFGVDPANVVSGSDVVHEKPHPEPYQRALAKCNVLPTEAIVVENAPLGVQSAKAAGIFTIAVNTGPLPDDALWQPGADVVLRGTDQLMQNWSVILDTFGTITP
jgi:beta-phosphoglucomutase